MARGAPDDSNVVLQGDVHRLDDMAELAVRLGSPLLYDRFGSVIMQDGFENGINAWSKTLTGVGAEIWAANDYSYDGQVSAHLYSGTGALPIAILDKFLPAVPVCKLGFQTSFHIDANLVEVIFSLNYHIAPMIFWFAVTYDHTTQILSYKEPGVGWNNFAVHPTLYAALDNWHTMKLVVDLVSRAYVRFSLDEVTYLLPGALPGAMAWATGSCIKPSVSVEGDPILGSHLYLDNLIATRHEF